METTLAQPVATSPTWSVLIPAYNRPERLQGCLDALSDLVAPNGGFEVVVVDDGSEPPLEPLVDKPQGLSLRMVRQKNAGPAAARNRAAQEAHGQWLAYTDDDCRPRPVWLCELERALSGETNRIAGGRTHNALNQNAASSASQALIDFLHDYFNRGEDGPSFFPSNNFAISREAYLDLGGFDPSFPLAAGEDRDFCDRALLNGMRLAYQPDAEIDHYHGMSVRGFWRQHFNYGRGAWVFHHARSARQQEPLRIEPLRFYFQLVGYPLREGLRWRSVKQSALLFLSQAANTLGFFYERRRSGPGR